MPGRTEPVKRIRGNRTSAFRAIPARAGPKNAKASGSTKPGSITGNAAAKGQAGTDEPHKHKHKSKSRQNRESFSFGTKYFMEHHYHGHHHDFYDTGKEKSTSGPGRNLPSCEDTESELEAVNLPIALRRCKPTGLGGGGEAEGIEGKNTYREPPNLENISTYEEYLDHYITDNELYYYESEEVARAVMSLRFTVPELLTRKEFNEIRAEIEAEKLARKANVINIGREINPVLIISPLMRVLAHREAENRAGSLATIIFVRMLNHKKQEVSAWIDFQVRLNEEGNLWYEYYTGRRKLTPSVTDLCYYNWFNYQCRFNSSENYLVTTDINAGLQFMHKDDRKLVTVNPRASPGENTDLFQIQDPEYMGCMVYDHFLRIKA